MTKRIIKSAIILLLLLILSGCSSAAEPSATHNTSLSEDVQEWIFMEHIPMPENPGNSFVSFDPDREIYITFQNVDVTLYSESTFWRDIQFLIYSKQYVDPADIIVDIHSKNVYEVTVTPKEVLRDTENNVSEAVKSTRPAYYFPFYVYQNYRGVDFSADNYSTIKRDALSNYNALKSEAIREFYIYSVNIMFWEIDIDETITEIDVTIDGCTYTQDIGEYRIIAGALPLELQTGNMSYSGIASFGQVQSLYNDGIGECGLYTFTVPFEMTLENFKIINNAIDVLDIIVNVQTSTSVTTEYYWDGDSPIILYEGDRVSLAIIFQEPLTAELSYYVNFYAVLDIKAFDTVKCITSEQLLYPYDLNCHELYAIVFDGLDMESYYRNYYYPTCESWREDYLN